MIMEEGVDEHSSLGIWGEIFPRANVTPSKVSNSQGFDPLRRQSYRKHRMTSKDPSVKKAPIPSPKNREEHAWFFSHLFFGYFFPIIWRGLRRPLETADLWQVHSLDRAEVAHAKFQRIWRPRYLQYQADLAKFEVAKQAHAASAATVSLGYPAPPAPAPPKKPTFLSAVFAVWGGRIAFSGFLAALQTATLFIGPLTLMPLIESIFYLRSGTPHNFPYHWAVLYILAPFLGALAQSQSERIMFHVANQMRTAMLTGVYEKVLHLNNASSSQTDSGQMITLISTDARQATEWIHLQHTAWTSPLSLIAGLVLVFRTIKWAGGPPLGLMVLTLPLQAVVSTKIMGAMKDIMSTSDERIKVTNETIQGIKVVKFSGLEEKFSDRMRASRAKQFKPLRVFILARSAFPPVPSFLHPFTFPSLLRGKPRVFILARYLPCFMMLIFRLVPTFINVLAFVSYALIYQDARPEIIFSAAGDLLPGPTPTTHPIPKTPHTQLLVQLAYLNLCSGPVSSLPLCFAALAQIAACMNRVGDFLLLPEKDATESAAALPAQTTDDALVSVRGATFKWAEPPAVPPSVMEGFIRAGIAKQLLAEWKRQAKQAAKEKRPPPPPPPTASEIPASIMAPILGLPVVKKETAEAAPAPSTPADANAKPLSQDPFFQLSVQLFDIYHSSRFQAAQLLAACQRAQEVEADEAAARREQPATLRGISFDVPRGSLTMVVGPVGSGKSSLAAALIGEITRVTGEVVVGGTLSYCAQQAWIANGTVRENILFGLPYDEERYRRAVEVCALEPDLKIMAAGDQTALGEKVCPCFLQDEDEGTSRDDAAGPETAHLTLIPIPYASLQGANLSGGQKQRISLARSVYSDREIYLWDDPLSAVDVHVGKHIFERCIRGQLRGRTMILITNQLQYLEQADQVVILKDGAIEAKGSYTDLRARGFDLSKYVPKKSPGPAAAEDGVAHPATTPTPPPATAAAVVAADAEPTVAKATAVETQKASDDAEDPEAKREAALKIISDEEHSTGAMPWRLYFSYLGTYSNFFGWVGLMALFIITEGASSVSSWWLQQWTGGAYLSILGPFYYPILIYAMIGVAQAIVAVIRTFLWANVSVRSASVVHERLMTSIVRAPTSFFDTTPVGRILNRFSGDLSQVDMQMSLAFENSFNMYLGTLAMLVVVGIGSWWFFVILVPIVAVFYLLQAVYRRTSREMQRLESISRSPCFAHFAETLAGLPTLRSYGLVDKWSREFWTKCDQYSSAFMTYRLGQKWMSFYQSLVSSGILAAAILLYTFTDVGAAAAGMGLSSVTAINYLIAQAVSSTVELESNMTSVERIQYYSEQVPQEHHEGAVPPAGWPQQGVVKFEEVSFRYRAKLPLVLRQVNFQTRPCEKVGVVGRTGAGKSSLLVVLFRLVELGHPTGSGRILLDGVDIAAVQLNLLRQHIAIIPQDPVLFSGTLRYNLDLAMTHQDAEIWAVLGHIHLRDFVTGLKDKLDTQITEAPLRTANRIRQLLCLGRALLHSSRVVVMDEATASLDVVETTDIIDHSFPSVSLLLYTGLGCWGTASVDVETDVAIQRTIRECFADRTVIIIAHRINTVMGCDRVMVMDQGQVAEFDQPQTLIDDPNSRFSGIVRGLSQVSIAPTATATATPVPSSSPVPR
ncbi:Multidrug resistance-associated protein [Paratrimastix pyriformis]|uniref:Multidrug resistance-associated protein n=1 Tax=Paratrimastix pyriformis TaxID=342808 RepID=A0ABQ8ULP3_9EUKA|nr:Multidrug resistance-associated protein [Paratrimastix pyriformis]